MPGFPSYCTGSLLEIPPSNTKQDWLSIGLRAILHAYPPVLPNQVHLRCVPLTSYGFLQTLPLANNALAIRIIFPSVRVIQVSFNLTGLPASLGKQKKQLNRAALNCIDNSLVKLHVKPYEVKSSTGTRRIGKVRQERFFVSNVFNTTVHFNCVS